MSRNIEVQIPTAGLSGLDLEKANAKIIIDETAGRARKKYITTVEGQDLTYSYKIVDAQKYIDDGRPADASPYPWTQAEADARGISASDAADIIVGTYNAWEPIGVSIEKERIKGKDKIDKANNSAVIEQERRKAIKELNKL